MGQYRYQWFLWDSTDISGFSGTVKMSMVSYTKAVSRIRENSDNEQNKTEFRQ